MDPTAPDLVSSVEPKGVHVQSKEALRLEVPIARRDAQPSAPHGEVKGVRQQAVTNVTDIELEPMHPTGVKVDEQLE